MTLRTVVVDDEALPRQRLADLVRADSRLVLAGEADDGRAALDLIVEQRPELVFLDIQMPELDGFQVIAALDDDVLPAIVFVTAYDAYAIRAFEVDAIDYLLKPVNAERFGAAVTRVVTRLHDAEPRPEAAVRTLASRASEARGTPIVRFVARRGAKHYFIRTSDIDWIEADGNYLRLWTGDRSHLVRETMKTAEERLDAAAFVRIHRSTIVAIDRIESIQAQDNGDYVVTMQGGAKLASSRGYADRIRGLLR
ncbi:MAG TPA: LytTR family DNA-binding domain-containing protein [Gemmatimonadaceae bacterium]|jgi:two-component system LytT family response regulator|nr:LytTR family DNA-binding domain-containing protein [Gemmatimonadaceae bacterium]